jgi:Protein of unknown function (DUF4232)
MLVALLAAAAIPPCSPVELLATGGKLQGATGSVAGTFAIQNLSSRRCLIGGRPRAVLVGADAKALKTKPLAVSTRHAITSVGPGKKAYLTVQWTNWCGPKPRGVLALRLTLTTGVTLSGPLRTGAPRCDSKSSASFLSTSAFSSAP